MLQTYVCSHRDPVFKRDALQSVSVRHAVLHVSLPEGCGRRAGAAVRARLGPREALGEFAVRFGAVPQRRGGEIRHDLSHIHAHSVSHSHTQTKPLTPQTTRAPATHRLVSRWPHFPLSNRRPADRPPSTPPVYRPTHPAPLIG